MTKLRVLVAAGCLVGSLAAFGTAGPAVAAPGHCPRGPAANVRTVQGGPGPGHAEGRDGAPGEGHGRGPRPGPGPGRGHGGETADAATPSVGPGGRFPGGERGDRSGRGDGRGHGAPSPAPPPGPSGSAPAPAPPPTSVPYVSSGHGMATLEAVPASAGPGGSNGEAGASLPGAPAVLATAPLAARASRTGVPAQQVPAPRRLPHRTPLAAVAGPWPGLSLKTARHLTVPILFGFGVAVFMLLQWLIDRRDPKVSRAPERGDDDTVGFS